MFWAFCRRGARRRLRAASSASRLSPAWSNAGKPTFRRWPPAIRKSQPPAAVKAALDRRLFARRIRGVAARPLPPAACWRSLAFWRGLPSPRWPRWRSIVALPLHQSAGRRAAERLVASLAAEDSDVHYLVVYDARTRDVGLSHVSGERGSRPRLRALGDRGPASAGVDGRHPGRRERAHRRSTTRRAARSTAGAVFAISLEPAGGSPTGQPTGPVVAAGDLKTHLIAEHLMAGSKIALS